jgi:dipeptidyl aminopeptidase/acylaminoacyl peptidase
MDDGPVRYYRYEREKTTATFLFANRKDLEGLTLSKMRSSIIRSRDQLDLVTYYTLPIWSDISGRPTHPLPMVLVVHGGPWGRDQWGYAPWHQMLANRGYVAISINFRGSTGLGKRFVNAGNMEWGGKMHDDLIDVVH